MVAAEPARSALPVSASARTPRRQSQPARFTRGHQYSGGLRQVTLRVYQDDRDDAEAVLETHDLDYLAVPNAGDEDEDAGTLFPSPLPSPVVPDVFDDRNDAGVSEEA